MIKKLFLLTLLTCLSAGLINPGAVQAEGELSVPGSSARVDFPSKITFNISAESNVDITDIRLCYQVERMEYASVFSEAYVSIEPDTRVSTDWVWDMRRTGGLPPGSSVSYWWVVTDSDGNQTETPPARIYIEDERYDWLNITEGDVTLYWYRGDEDFAGQLMSATQDALSRLAAETGAALENPVSIYIYANSTDLQGSMIYPQEWTGGVAFVRYGIIAIGISPTTMSIDWGKRVIAHELTHLVVEQVTFNPYNDLPTWLDEGLAMNSEGELEDQFVGAFHQAKDDDTLISVRSLSSPFSAYTGEALLAYAESYYIVKYLIDEYGRDKMFQLLNTFGQGSGYDEALVKVYGFDMDGLDAEWQATFRNVVVR
jgi:hypothetical protein